MSERPPSRVYFDECFSPHRSLSGRGFFFIILGLSLISMIIGTAFVLMGAWPVFGFFGLDVLLVYIALRVSFRQARIYERVALTDSVLRVERLELSGRRQEFTFEPAWVRVETEDNPGSRQSLHLASHGRRVNVGAFLAPEQRAALAEDLRAALHTWRRSLTER